METNRLNNTAIKLKRLGVNYKVNNDNSITLRGTTMPNGELFLTIISPLFLFTLTVTFIIIQFSSPIFDKIIIPKILIILPLVLFFYGIKNLLRFKKSSKISVKIKKGNIELIDKQGTQVVISKNNMRDIISHIEENEGSYIGVLYAIDINNNKYSLLTLIDNHPKYLKNDIEYIRETLKTIIES
jgi:hypothetical protein